jgi:hypothetical protein
MVNGVGSAFLIAPFGRVLFACAQALQNSQNPTSSSRPHSWNMMGRTVKAPCNPGDTPANLQKT